MARLLYVCILLSLVLAQLHRDPLVTIGSHSLSFTIPTMAPRHGGTSMEHSCICGAGFTQEQHLARHKRNCSTPIEIAERAFGKGLRHKHRPTVKRKRPENGASWLQRIAIHSLRNLFAANYHFRTFFLTVKTRLVCPRPTEARAARFGARHPRLGQFEVSFISKSLRSLTQMYIKPICAVGSSLFTLNSTSGITQKFRSWNRYLNPNSTRDLWLGCTRDTE